MRSSHKETDGIIKEEVNDKPHEETADIVAGEAYHGL